MSRRPPRSTLTDTLFPYTTLFRSCRQAGEAHRRGERALRFRLHLVRLAPGPDPGVPRFPDLRGVPGAARLPEDDRRAARANLWTERDQTLRHRSRRGAPRSEEHTYEMQSILRRSYAVLCLNIKNK